MDRAAGPPAALPRMRAPLEPGYLQVSAQVEYEIRITGKPGSPVPP